MPSATEIVIEFDKDNNGSALFPPLTRIVRGRFTRERIPPGLYDAPDTLQQLEYESIQSIPPVPGLCFLLDPVAKRRALFDPLAEDPTLLAKLKKYRTVNSQSGLSPGYVAMKTDAEENLTRDKIATLWYWMRRACTDQPHWAILRSGSFDKAPQGVVQLIFGVYSKIPDKDPMTGNHIFSRYLHELQPEAAVEFGWDLRRKRYPWEDDDEPSVQLRQPRLKPQQGQQPREG